MAHDANSNKYNFQPFVSSFCIFGVVFKFFKSDLFTLLHSESKDFEENHHVWERAGNIL